MKGRELLTGPVRIDIVASFASKETGWRISKPDWDNIGKIVTDSLNKIVYLDDSQVSFVTVVKFNQLGDYLSVTCQPLDDVNPLQSGDTHG